MASKSPSGPGAGKAKSTFDFEHKVIIIGDAGAGKSSFFHQFRQGVFPKQVMSTIGVEFGTKIIQLQNEERRVKLNVWDTAGQERYRAVTRAYYRGALGSVILYDTTSRLSFNHLPDWLQDAREQASSDIDIVVVGNKKDLKEQRQVTHDEASKWANTNEVIYIETSALTGENVEDVFQILGQHIQARMDKDIDAKKRKAAEAAPLKLEAPVEQKASASCGAC